MTRYSLFILFLILISSCGESVKYTAKKTNSTTSSANNAIEVSNKTDLVVHVTIKTVKEKYQLNEVVTFVITLANMGSVDASNIKLTNVLPSGVLFQDAIATSGYYDETTGAWNLPKLGMSLDAILEINAKINSASAGKILKDEVTSLIFDGFDTNLTPDDLSESIAVELPIIIHHPPVPPVALHPSVPPVAISPVSIKPVSVKPATGVVVKNPALVPSSTPRHPVSASVPASVPASAPTVPISAVPKHLFQCGVMKEFLEEKPLEYDAIGEGTLASPYLIYTAEQLLDLSNSGDDLKAMMAHFELRSDINLADFYENGGTEFEIPKASSLKAFRGKFNGNNCFILGFKKNHGFSFGVHRYGLFSKAIGAKLENIKLQNSGYNSDEVLLVKDSHLSNQVVNCSVE